MDTLSIESGLITKGNRIIVPIEMRPEMLQYINDEHHCEKKYLLCAKDTVVLPGIT